MKDLIKSQFDKLILLLLIILFMLFMACLLLRFPNLDAGTLQWIEKSIDMAEGAVIGAVTTAAVMRSTTTSEGHTETMSSGAVTTDPVAKITEEPKK